MALISSCSRCAMSLPSSPLGGIQSIPPGLLTYALQGPFDFSGFGRSKLPVLVDEDNTLSLDMDHHVWLAIAIDVLERQGDGRHILSIPKQRWSKIDHGMRTVPSRALDHLHATVQVDGDKMAWTGCRVVIADDGIHLEGTRPAVVPVILGHLPPSEELTPHHPQRQHCQHPYSKKEQPMAAGPGWFLCLIRFYAQPSLMLLRRLS